VKLKPFYNLENDFTAIIWNFTSIMPIQVEEYHEHTKDKSEVKPRKRAHGLRSGGQRVVVGRGHRLEQWQWECEDTENRGRAARGGWAVGVVVEWGGAWTSPTEAAGKIVEVTEADREIESGLTRGRRAHTERGAATRACTVRVDYGRWRRFGNTGQAGSGIFQPNLRQHKTGRCN
jgi:hypothetical protein